MFRLQWNKFSIKLRHCKWLTKMLSHTQRIPFHRVSCATNCQHSIISEEFDANQDSHNPTAAAMYSHPDQSCFVCGHPRHPRNLCPAKNSKCKLCGRTGHWEPVCKSSNKTSNSLNNQYRQQNQQQQRYQHGTSAAIWPLLAAILQGRGGTTAYCKIKIKKSKINALIDTGSTSCSFIHKQLVTRLKLPIIPAVGEVSMANASFTTKVEGECIVDIQLRKRKYEKVKLYILDNLCAEVILGQDFMEQHKSVVFNSGGSKPSLIVSALTAMNVTPPSLFGHLTDDCRPVAVRSRKQTPSNAKFIREEVKSLLNDGIIKPSTSPWRAQVLVTKEDETHRKRMVVDYKQSINRFTELDTYPLPDTEEMVREISHYSWFSIFDLKSAYRQIPISGEDQKYMAFEADGGLWEFTRMPFGVTNGVSKFQRNIDSIVEKEGLPATFPFLDNVTVCGRTEQELKENEAQFRSFAKKYNLTLTRVNQLSVCNLYPF